MGYKKTGKRSKYLYRVSKHEARVYCDNTGSIGTPPVSCDYKQSISRLLKITVGLLLIA